MKSRSEKIREQLERNPSISPLKLAEKLGVTTQHVYQVRHDMRKKQEALRAAVTDRLNRAKATRDENSQPLSAYILQVLESNPQGLTVQAIVTAVIKAGYKTRSTTFLQVVRQKLYNMVEVGHVARNGNSYLHPKPKAVIQQVQAVPHQVPAVPVGQLSVFEALQELSKLSKQVGGIDQLQAKLDMLRELQAQ